MDNAILLFTCTKKSVFAFDSASIGKMQSKQKTLHGLMGFMII